MYMVCNLPITCISKCLKSSVVIHYCISLAQKGSNHAEQRGNLLKQLYYFELGNKSGSKQNKIVNSIFTKHHITYAV